VKIRAAMCACALVLCQAAGVSGQKLEPGRWTGNVTVAEMPSQVMTLSFDVKAVGDSVEVMMTFDQMPQMPMKLNGLKIADNKLTFTFSPPNAVVSCSLALQEDRSWAGDCADEGGDTARVTMIPPKKDGAGVL